MLREMLDEMNAIFAGPLAERHLGGGNAALMERGRAVAARDRAMKHEATAMARERLDTLQGEPAADES